MSILAFAGYWLAASVLFVSGYVYRVAMERAR